MGWVFRVTCDLIFLPFYALGRVSNGTRIQFVEVPRMSTFEFVCKSPQRAFRTTFTNALCCTILLSRLGKERLLGPIRVGPFLGWH